MKEKYDTYMTSDADSHDDVVQCQGTFLDLLNFIVGKSLIEYGIDSILTNDHWQTQKHFMIYTVIALHQQSLQTFSFLPRRPLSYWKLISKLISKFMLICSFRKKNF